VFGSDHPDVAASYTNIGNVYDSQGQYERALEYYQKGLEINIKVSGQDHPDVAASIKNIGIVYHNKGDRAAATEMYTKAYHIFLKVLGPHHPETQGLKPFVPSVAGGVPETGKRDGH
jgi:tetratricopeptide (TPR) repeat protein